MRIRPLLVPDIGQTRPDFSTTTFFATAVARRNYLLCNTVAAGVMNSVSTFWHGVKVDRPPEVTPVRRACAYVERRSGLLDVAYRRANLRHEPLTF